jgi:iron complex outermembrane receptor protein
MTAKRKTGSRPDVATTSKNNNFRAARQRRWVAALVMGTVSAIPAHFALADTTNTNTVPAAAKVTVKSDADLVSLDLDALANTQVTSASGKAEKLSDAATAITELSNDDIKRSGATSIPDALRLVPGMDVAQINSSTYAVSARGFDEIYSRSLLVLVDGRTVFGPFNGGVTWDLQQQMLDDLDRIEVIKGPGGTLWGANAVNGVINIVSKSARDTQGTLLYGGGGNVEQTMDGARYGGKLNDNTYYRVFGSFEQTESFDAPGGGSAGTRAQGGEGGFRMDHYGAHDATQLTWQGDATYNNLLDNMSRDYNVNTLGRWTRTFSPRSSLQIQAYFDRTDSDAWGGVDLGVNTYDVTLQHNLALGDRNDVVWGMGYRLWDVHLGVVSDPTLVHVANFSEQRGNIFAQDEFHIIPDKLSLTAGIKVEYNDITGVEYEPNVRLKYKPTENQTLWAAVSRSVLVPTLKAGYDGYRQPDNIGALNTYDLGNPNIKSAPVMSYELGYRIQPVKRVSVDIATYYNHYSGLQNQVQTGTVYTWENAFQAETYGGEASVTFQPVDSLRLTAFYAHMHINEWGAVPDTDVLHGSPQNQAGLHASWDITKRVSADGQLRYVDQVAGAKPYVTGDLRLAYRITDNVELAVVGQNLFKPNHVELGAGVTGEVPTGVFGKLTVKF